MVEIASDSEKMLSYFRRPVPEGAEDIGVWFSVFSMTGDIAVVTNAALTSFTLCCKRLVVGLRVFRGY